MVLNQNPMEIPSEPIRKERICQNFIRSPRGESRFLVYYCESDPPLKKTMWGALTIVDATLPAKPISITQALLCFANSSFVMDAIANKGEKKRRAVLTLESKRLRVSHTAGSKLSKPLSERSGRSGKQEVSHRIYSTMS